MKRTWMIWVLSVAGLSAANDTPEMVKQRAAAMYGKLPLSFERNEGQTDSRVRFLARGRGYGLFLTRREAVLSLAGQDKQRATLRVGLGHASAGGADPEGVDTLQGRSNYFTGNDPSKWHTGVNNYAGVKYTGVYPGIDLVYHGNQGQLEYDFDVAPGADPQRIELRFQGARQLRIDSAGDLVVSLGQSELIEHRPVVYQEAGGKRDLVAGSYVLHGRDRVGFRLGGYDRSRTVVIDPTLMYSTYFGDDEVSTGIAIDAAENAYVTGATFSTNLPVTPGVFQTSFGGGGCCSGDDAFVTKLNANGSALIYSTYLGGSDSDSAYGIALDFAGNAYVTGDTNSTDFPVTPGTFQTNGPGAFVSKLNESGSALIYSTILGGINGATSRSITVDATGNAYVTGQTFSDNFPVTPGAFQTSSSVEGDAFVTKLDATGSALIYSTYLGGGSIDFGVGIAVDSTGNAYVTGFTGSTDFPVTPQAFQTSLAPGYAGAFVTKLNPAGSALIYSSYLGGTDSTQASGIAVDSAGNAYVGGFTRAPDFPVTPGAFQTSLSGAQLAFITKFNGAGSALLYSTFLGGSKDYSFGPGIAVDATGNAYVTGFTQSPDFPVTPGAFHTSFAGCDAGCADAFVTKLNATGSALLYSTFLGSGGGTAIASDSAGNAFITGRAGPNFPVTPGAFQTAYLGGLAAFIAKLDTTQFGPIINIAGYIAGPPREVQIRSQDLQAGLASIQVLECANCTAVTDSFTVGTKDPVITTATKTDQRYSSAVQIEATDLNGNLTIFDPTDITIQADGRAEIRLVRISALEHVVLVTNAIPGVRAIVLRVHGKDIPVLSLKDGETRTVDIAAELKSGRDNEVTVLSWGPRGASASVVFTQP